MKCKLGTDTVEFTGPFVLDSPLGPFDSFHIRLVVPLRFPDGQPRVWEIGGRLPRDIDRHVYADGECCITVWESWLIGAESVTIADFVTGPLFNFFLSQHRVENGSDWSFGEWKHDVRGRIDALAESLRLAADDLAIAKFLVSIAKPDFRQTDVCPCGSTRRAYKCHRVVIERARNRIGQSGLVSIASSLVDNRLKLEKRVAAIENICSIVQLPNRSISLKRSFSDSVSMLTIYRMLSENK